jgi:hypothetical protein
MVQPNRSHQQLRIPRRAPHEQISVRFWPASLRRWPTRRRTVESLPDGWQVEVSEIEPAVGQPGGAMQVRIISSENDVVPVDDLLELGILR